MRAFLPEGDPEREAADIKACRDSIRHGSRTFFAASLVLPKRVRNPSYALYAFCRLADDAVDVEAKGGEVERLRRRLDLAYAGRPIDCPADRAFARTVERHAIPYALPEGLIEGLAWDAAGRRYATLRELEAYAARVAGTVGAMMAVLMGARSEDALARACELGLAMQFTNIARDIAEDAANGRLYLPGAWLIQAGIEPEAWLRRPVFDHRVKALTLRLLRLAEGRYRRATPGIAALPPDCRPGILAARLLYAEIGRKAATMGVERRAVVARPRQALLLARALADAPFLAPARPRAPLHAVRHLVAAARLPGRSRVENTPLTAVETVIDLFTRLERNDRLARWAGTN